MSERIYIIGGTGNVGSAVVKELLKKNVSVTVYVRSSVKAQTLFGNDANLTIVEGDLNDLKPFEETIGGHTRLFLLVHDMQNLVKFKTAVAQKAYAAGVKQIVHNSGISVSESWRKTFLGANHRAAEEAIYAIPNRGAYVALRPINYMTNYFLFDANNIKTLSVLADNANPDTVEYWISPNDIGLVAANIFQDPIEKHGDSVYELVGDSATYEERAKLLTKALGQTITFKKISLEEKYANLLQVGIPHFMAYNFLEAEKPGVSITPGLSLLLGRQPETLAQWIDANKAALKNI